MAKKSSKKSKKKKAKEIKALPSSREIEHILSEFVKTLGLEDEREQKEEARIAQELVYDAWEAPTRREAIALAKKALKIYPNCADAYCILAEEARSLEEALELYQKAVQAAERDLGEEIFKECEGMFWGMLSTRPYMRARAGLAECLWDMGRKEEAIGHFWDLLRLNPNDNQGIRYLLMPCLIELGRDKEAEKLFKRYKNEGSTFWQYSRALLDFRKCGNSPKTRESLRKALKRNPHVPGYLLGQKRLPLRLPEYYSLGDENEAIIYAVRNYEAWKVTPGALQWLESQQGMGI